MAGYQELLGARSVHYLITYSLHCKQYHSSAEMVPIITKDITLSVFIQCYIHIDHFHEPNKSQKCILLYGRIP